MIYVTSSGASMSAIVKGAVRLTARKMFRKSQTVGFGIEILETHDGEAKLKIINKKARKDLRSLRANGDLDFSVANSNKSNNQSIKTTEVI